MCSYTEDKGVIYTEALITLPVLVLLLYAVIYVPRVHYAGIKLQEALRFYLLEAGRNVISNDGDAEKYFEDFNEEWRFSTTISHEGSSGLGEEFASGDGFAGAIGDVLDFILGSRRVNVSVTTGVIVPLGIRVSLSGILKAHLDPFHGSVRAWVPRSVSTLYALGYALAGSSEQGLSQHIIRNSLGSYVQKGETAAERAGRRLGLPAPAGDAERSRGLVDEEDVLGAFASECAPQHFPGSER